MSDHPDGHYTVDRISRAPPVRRVKEPMHARMITFRPREGRFDEVTRVLKERTLGEAQRRPGFLGFVVMCDRGGGKIVSNTYWNTEADMLSGDESSEYLQDQYSRVVALLRGPPVVEHFEVETLS